MPDNPLTISKGKNTVNSFDGVPICYYAEGNGEPALVFVYGWACDKSHRDAQAKHFSMPNTVEDPAAFNRLPETAIKELVGPRTRG